MENAELTAEKEQKSVPGVPFTKDDPRINREGRPLGSFSLKTLIIKRLQENPDQKERIIDDLLAKDQGLILQMIDGKPKQSLDVKGDISVTTDPEKRALIENAIDSITAE